MQLTYRGSQYNAVQATHNTVNSGITVSYRGRLYTVPCATAVPTMPVQTLRYRGIVIGASDADYRPVFRPASA